MKIAVILFNLGGPDGPAAVEPFLFNLFRDPAIIGAPQPMRWMIAKLISSRRAPVARDIYAHLGGASPIVSQTEAQARKLEAALAGEADEYRAFIAMRYWHPFAREAAEAARDWGAERVVLLPLYPQFSTTTTGSSVTDWTRAAGDAGLTVPTSTICCYFDDPKFIAAHVTALERAIAGLDSRQTRILFSAHGLPEKIVRKGDPYQWQIERTVAAITDEIGDVWDSVVCYQSRVGPMKWIGPSTEEEIRRAGADGKTVVVVPIAFVSEHSETLVELDIEYRKLAGECGVPAYFRVPALGDDDGFIQSLADLLRRSGTEFVQSLAQQQCPAEYCKCLGGNAT